MVSYFLNKRNVD